MQNTGKNRIKWNTGTKWVNTQCMLTYNFALTYTIMEVKAHLVFLEALQGDRKGLQLNLLVISINVDRLLIKINSD